MRLKPIEGRQVPDPEKGGYLPPDGRPGEPSQYWLRRQLDGDITIEEDETATQVAVSISARNKGSA